MKKFMQEFKKFAMRGNVMDMAVGVIIGAAFGKIVTSLVNDLFMPLIGLITGGASVSGMFALLGKAPEGVVISSVEEAAAAGVATLNYGSFIQTVIDFVLVALCIFMVVKLFNKLERKKPEAPPAPPARLCPYCFGELNEKATRCPHCTSGLDDD